MLGKKSGLDSIRLKAEELGLELPEDRHAEVLAAVKGLGDEKRRLVTDAEFRALVAELLLTDMSPARDTRADVSAMSAKGVRA